MNADVFAQWLERQGHQIIRTPSSYWFDQGPRVYQAFPYHRLILPSADELECLFKDFKARGLRYSTPLYASEGIASYHVVYEEKRFPIEQLPKKVRYDVKKGLNIARVERISFSRLATEGWQLRWETLQRQGRTKAETAEWWKKLCISAESLSGFETWAAISLDGTMTAALIAFTCEDCCSILYQQSLTAYLSKGVNNALAFAFTNEVLKRPGKPWVFYGLHSLDAPSSVDEFKFRMGFKAKPVRQRVVFHPTIAPFFNRLSHATVRQLLRWRPEQRILAKAEGMTRFYLQGKLPLEKQAIPQGLLAQRLAEGVD